MAFHQPQRLYRLTTLRHRFCSTLTSPLRNNLSTTSAMAQSRLRKTFPWTHEPIIVSAPMRPYAKHELAVAVTLAGGLGFVANCNDTSQTRTELEAAAEKLQGSSLAEVKAAAQSNLPIGLGYQIYQESLDEAVQLIAEFRPIAVWLFAARRNNDYAAWASAIREASPSSTIWIQVGTIADALTAVELCGKEIILVLQGSDSGGHGLQQSAGLITFLPEAIDSLKSHDIPIFAAGGISDGRGAAAALLLGADGVVLGTRFLAATEATTPKGFLQHILDTSDGGANTRRTRLFDDLRGTGDFPDLYDGRALVNQSVRDDDQGIPLDEVKQRYAVALKSSESGFGDLGRLVSYAGTGVGLIKEVKSAGEIMDDIRTVAAGTIDAMKQKSLNWKSEL